MHITPGRPATFLMNDVCVWAGVTAAQVEHWVRQHAILPLQESTGSGSYRLFSLTNVIESAIARELTSSGIAVKQIVMVLGQLRDQVNKLPLELQASATFLRYVEMVDAIVVINGPGPNYDAWRKDAAAVVRSWKRKPQPLDQDILRILASARAADRSSVEPRRAHE
jgi:DNA-binding transcriptional MerR regulator